MYEMYLIFMHMSIYIVMCGESPYAEGLKQQVYCNYSCGRPLY